MRHPIRIFMLMALALLIAAACAADMSGDNALEEKQYPSDEELATVERVSLDYVKARLNNPDVIIVDVRIVDGIIPTEKVLGALVEDWEKVPEWSRGLSKDKEIITYCACPKEFTGAAVALELQGLGFKDVKTIEGGWNAWKAGGYPVVPTGSRQE